MTTAQERADDVADSKDARGRALVEALEKPAVLDYIQSVATDRDPKGLVRVALAHVTSSQALARCSPRSIALAVCEAAKLGLSVDGTLGHAYMVPYGRVAKMMLGYRGIIHLAWQSGLVSRIHADVICSNDEYSYEETSEGPKFYHRPPQDLTVERGEMVGAFAMAHLTKGGPPLIVVHDLAEIHRRRSRSASYKRNKEQSPWTTDPKPMFRKCPIRDLGSRIPAPALQTVALRDEAREEDRPIPEEPDPQLEVVANWFDERGEGREPGQEG